MLRECRERFPRHRGLAISTYITARVLLSLWRRKRSGIPGATHKFTYLLRGPWRGWNVLTPHPIPPSSFHIRTPDKIIYMYILCHDVHYFPQGHTGDVEIRYRIWGNRGTTTNATNRNPAQSQANSV